MEHSLLQLNTDGKLVFKVSPDWEIDGLMFSESIKSPIFTIKL